MLNDVSAVADTLARAEGTGLFPAQALAIRRVAEDPASNLADLEAAVATDPALAATLMRLANSSFYGLRWRVRSLRQAVLVLGFNATRDLALALALAAMGRSIHPLRATLRSRAARGAILSRRLATLIPKGAICPEQAFVAALLRDLGQVLLLELHPDDYGPLAQAFPNDPRSPEVALLSFDHTELAAACLSAWHLPPPIVSAVADHHEPPVASGLSALVYLANQLETLIGESMPLSTIQKVVDGAAELLELPDRWFEHALDSLPPL